MVRINDFEFNLLKRAFSALPQKYIENYRGKDLHKDVFYEMFACDLILRSKRLDQKELEGMLNKGVGGGAILEKMSHQIIDRVQKQREDPLLEGIFRDFANKIIGADYSIKDMYGLRMNIADRLLKQKPILRRFSDDIGFTSSIEDLIKDNFQNIRVKKYSSTLELKKLFMIDTVLDQLKPSEIKSLLGNFIEDYLITSEDIAAYYLPFIYNNFKGNSASYKTIIIGNYPEDIKSLLKDYKTTNPVKGYFAMVEGLTFLYNNNFIKKNLGETLGFVANVKDKFIRYEKNSLVSIYVFKSILIKDSKKKRDLLHNAYTLDKENLDVKFNIILNESNEKHKKKIMEEFIDAFPDYNLAREFYNKVYRST
jgi:hypothetical protein